MEDFTRMLRESIWKAFFNWLEVNRNTLGKRYGGFYCEGKKAEAETNTIGKIIGYSMWMFNMIADCGVMAGVGPNKVMLHSIAAGIDEASTKRILVLISTAIGLQCLPLEIMNQEIPIISKTHFSLALLSKEQGDELGKSENRGIIGTGTETSHTP